MLNGRRAVVFDLDGTLLNSLADLAASMNRTLTRHGHPTHPVDAYRWFIGDGVENLARRALPEESIARRSWWTRGGPKEMRADYAGHWADETRPYPGIAGAVASG